MPSQIRSRLSPPDRILPPVDFHPTLRSGVRPEVGAHHATAARHAGISSGGGLLCADPARGGEAAADDDGAVLEEAAEGAEEVRLRLRLLHVVNLLSRSFPIETLPCSSCIYFSRPRTLGFPPPKGSGLNLSLALVALFLFYRKCYPLPHSDLHWARARRMYYSKWDSHG